jgi:galactarate dehydratase
MMCVDEDEAVFIRTNPEDNVAIAATGAKAGQTACGVILLEDIPPGHKAALVPIPRGGKILRYGVVIGYAREDIGAGRWIHEAMLDLPAPPELGALCPGGKPFPVLPKPEEAFFEGFANTREKDGYGGVRNILAIHTTVQCVTGVLNAALRRIKAELLPRFPNVDDVVAVNHAYGCGVAIDAPDAAIPISALHNLIENPNFGGEIMVVGLGCEKLTPARLLSERDNRPENLIILQNYHGFQAMMEAILEMAGKKLEVLNRRRRERLPLSRLIIGVQCGGSDAFSGITANPVIGYAADLIAAAGGTTLFSEVTEVRDGVHILARRTADDSVCAALIREMDWFDRYLAKGGAGREANTSPGNKEGGLSNITEKAMGSIVKSGSAPLAEVLSPGQRPGRHGLIFAATPAGDMVCGPMQLAAGITLQVFSTGRGTPYGLAAAPVIKVSSNSALKDKWPDLIDFDAGRVVSACMTIPGAGMALFRMILDTASDRTKPASERLGLYNDFCIFDPSPVT